MHTLIKHPLVDRDIEQAAIWYREQDVAVALRFIEEIRLAYSLVPLSQTTNMFPTIIWFRLRRVRMSGDTVFVLAVLHGAREVEQLIQTRKAPR